MLLKDLLIHIRATHKLTQSQLAKELEIHQPNLSAYERGTTNPELIALSKIITYANKKCKMKLKIADFRKHPKNKTIKD